LSPSRSAPSVGGKSPGRFPRSKKRAIHFMREKDAFSIVEKNMRLNVCMRANAAFSTAEEQNMRYFEKI
jgi:hypothetical protein